MAIEKVTATVKKDVAPKATATVKVDALKTPVETKVEAKKPAAKKETAPKAATKKAEAKPAAKKTTAAKATAKPAAKKETAPKATTKKAAAKPAAKKTTAPKAATKATKTVVTLEYADKKYTQADLEKIANDVWVYDYGKKAADLKSVELYVKPYEDRVYYVFNGDVVGSFQI